MMTFVFMGCATTSTSPTGGEALPRLGEMRSQVTPMQPPEVDEPGPERRAMATIQQVELPLYTNLDECWPMTSEGVLGDHARAVWNANGMRVGMTSMAEAERFFEPLPYVLNVRDARLISGAYPSALRTSPTIGEPVRMDLSGVAGGDEQVLELDRGRMRLLIGMEPNAVGGVTVTLLPHQQVRRFTLSPRGPQEVEMDGRLFEELAVSFDMNQDDVLVLGLYWPWPDEEDDSAREGEAGEEAVDGEGGEAVVMMDAAEGGEAWEPEADTGEEAEADGPALPAHFGRALFANRRAGTLVQNVVLVHVSPAGGVTPAPTQPGVSEVPGVSSSDEEESPVPAR
ncbi:hypothetical protein ACERK3_08190 [Phycisphaerales bacterium AB-hyl4]|uniref:Uncharacterized protein n=1 Tax=Natronomicrosphaera hydrolytica TaxID=3242702 RepID=A0ABV4U3U8_9BACT